MKRRILVPLIGIAVLVLLELALSRALAAREPLRAVLSGQLHVVILALATLSLRLFLFTFAPGWLLAACVGAWLSSRGSAPSSPAPGRSARRPPRAPAGPPPNG